MNCKVCGNTSIKNPSASFFRFPKENSKCREWAIRCDLLPLYELHGTLRFYKSFRICSDHFDPKYIVFDGRKKKLLEHAMPQILVTCKNVNEEKQEGCKIPKRQLCRLCAEEDRNLTDIFGLKGRILNLESKIKYLPVVINKYDNLPLKVCNQCITKLNEFHEFSLNSMKAEAKLRIMLNLVDCDTSNQVIEPNVESQENLKLDLRTEQSFDETPNVNLSVTDQGSPNLMTSFPENLEDVYCDQGSFTNEDENFSKQSESDFANTNKLTKCTNFVKEVDCSKNITFIHDYSNLVTNNELLFDSKNNTGNNQEFQEEIINSYNICVEALQNPTESNTQLPTNSDQSILRTELFCGVCNALFDNKVDFDEHTCQHLEKSYTYINNENSHEVIFLDENIFTQQLENSCDDITNLRSSPIYSNPNKNKPRLHRRSKSKSSKSPKTTLKFKKRKCKFCDKIFKNRQYCQDHEKTHTGLTPYLCTQCGKEFRLRTSLTNHKFVHMEKRKNKCKECGMSFKRKDTLKIHFRTHTGERPYVCKICYFAFKQRGDCIKHEKNHKNTSEENKSEENLRQLNEERSTVIVSPADILNKTQTASAIEKVNSIINDPQSSSGIPWNEENKTIMPSFETKLPEQESPVEVLEDILLIPINFLM